MFIKSNILRQIGFRNFFPLSAVISTNTKISIHIASIRRANNKWRIKKLRDILWNGLKDMEEIYLNGDLDQRIPGNLNISFNFVEGESLIMAIKGMAVSSGSACTSASLEPSYVLRALGYDEASAHSSIRFGFGRFTSSFHFGCHQFVWVY